MTVSTEAHQKHGKGHGGEAAVKWLWNGSPFERHTIARSVKIFTVNHYPPVGFPRHSWSHVNDFSFMIQAQEVIVEEAAVIEEAAIVEEATVGETVHSEAVQEAAAEVEPVGEAIGEVATAGEAGSLVDPPDHHDNDPERENLQPGNVTNKVSTEGEASVGRGNEGEAEHGYMGDMQEEEKQSNFGPRVKAGTFIANSLNIRRKVQMVDTSTLYGASIEPGLGPPAEHEKEEEQVVDFKADEEHYQGLKNSPNLHNFEISPFSTPPRNMVLDVSLESHNKEEHQEALEGLEQEEKYDKEKAEDVRGEDFISYCVYCDTTVCDCEDKQQVIFFPSDEEYYDDLDEASRKHSGNLDGDERFRGSEDEGVEVVTNVGAEDEETEILDGLEVFSLEHPPNLDRHREF